MQSQRLGQRKECAKGGSTSEERARAREIKEREGGVLEESENKEREQERDSAREAKKEKVDEQESERKREQRERD
eukprot:3760136-Rhodomonas_salina.1